MFKLLLVILAPYFIINCTVFGQEVFNQNSKIINKYEIYDEELNYHEEFFNSIRSNKIKYSFKKNAHGLGYYY